MKKKVRFNLIGLVGLVMTALVGAAQPAIAETSGCSAPSQQKKQELASYVAKQYHWGQAQVTVADAGRADDACFWTLKFEAAVPQKREILLYLSPDGHYLAPTLYDVRIDPLVEERKAAAQLSESLLAGSPHSLGPKDAPVTIVEFSDFQCPFCKRFTDVWENQLTPEERQKVRIVFRNYPLPMHPLAKPAAEAAECVALQNPDAFWKVHDYLFNNQQTFKADTLQGSITDFATTNAGVDKAQLDNCLQRRLSAGPVEVDIDLATKNNVHATPTFFVNGTRYEGAKTVAQLRDIITMALQDNQLAAK